jgi:hypothetical protein
MSKKRKNSKKLTISKKSSKKLNSHSKEENEYLVESIEDWALHDSGLKMYLLKWKDFDSSHNSWEFHNNCNKLIDLKNEFHKQSVNGRHPPKYSWQEFHKFVHYLKHILDNHFNDLIVLNKLNTKTISLNQNLNQLIEKLKSNIRLEYNKLISHRFTHKTNRERIASRILAQKIAQKLNIYSNFGSITQFFEFIDNRKSMINESKALENNQNSIKVSPKVLKPMFVSTDERIHFDYNLDSIESYCYQVIDNTIYSYEEITPFGAQVSIKILNNSSNCDFVPNILKQEFL